MAHSQSFSPKSPIKDIFWAVHRLHYERSKSCDISSDIIAKLLKFFDPDTPIGDIKGHDVRMYVEHRLNDGVKQGTVRRELSVMSKCYNYAIKEMDLVVNNPVLGRMPSQEKFTEVVVIDLNMVGNIVANIDDQRIKNLVELAYFTGLRLSELVNLDWEQIDLKNQTISFTPREQKSNKFSKSALNDAALVVLKRCSRDEKGLFKVFPGITAYMVKREWARMKRQTGIQARFHDLRHSACTRMLKRGADIRDVQHQMRHSTLATTELYDHSQEESAARAVQYL